MSPHQNATVGVRTMLLRDWGRSTAIGVTVNARKMDKAAPPYALAFNVRMSLVRDKKAKLNLDHVDVKKEAV